MSLNAAAARLSDKTPRTRGVSAMVCVSTLPLPSSYPSIPFTMLFIIFPDTVRDLLRSLLPSRRRKRKQHFKSATTGVATKNMRNELNRLVNTVSDPQTRKVRSQSDTLAACYLQLDIFT